MKEILTSTDLTISFSDKDIIDVIPFGSKIIDIWSTSEGLSREDILDKIYSTELNGATALYPASIKAIELLNEEENEEYVSSVILMTDGQANVGTYSELENYYLKIGKEYPIYSITFGNADESELSDISNLTNGKVFNGKENLLYAFKKVRGYN